MDTKQKGDIAELTVAKYLISQGYAVSFPYGDNERYDLIWDTGEELRKVQVRHASKRGDYIAFKCYSNHRKSGEIARKSFSKSNIDDFIVWNEEINKIYRVGVEEAPETEMRLRLSSTGNNQEQNVNWAEDYEIKR